MKNMIGAVTAGIFAAALLSFGASALADSPPSPAAAPVAKVTQTPAPAAAAPAKSDAMTAKPAVTATTKAAAAQAPKPKTLSRHAVEQMQTALDDQGAKIAIDGIWGRDTTKALEAFQKDRGLKVTGHLDRATRKALSLTA